MIKSIVKNTLLLFQDYLSLTFKVKYLNYLNKPVRIKLQNFEIWGNNFSTLKYLKKEIFEKREYFFVSESLNPVILDCGSNIGMSVIYFKHLYPDAKIIAFEPNPDSFQFLKKNVEINKLKDIDLFNVCLSNNKESVDFYTGPVGKNSLIGSMYSSRTDVNKIKVNSLRLSEFVMNKTIDIVKIDVEGAEWLIMRDLIENKCTKNIKKFLIEYHHKIDSNKSQLSSFLKLFEDNGFDYNIRTNYQNSGSFQDVFIEAYLIDQG